VGSHQRRHGQSRPFDNAASVGACPVCGKVSYISKAAAKRNARQTQRRGGQVERAWLCGSGYWHLSAQDAATVTEYRERAAGE
jgi:hypothetical protein